MPHKKIWIILGSVLWLAGLAYGMGRLFDYSFSEGRLGEVAGQWPQDSRIDRGKNMPSLLLFAHPRCPCSRASLAELERILARVSGKKVEVTVVFVKPDGTGGDWARTDLRNKASKMPGIRILEDQNGSEAKRFGAKTSGHVFLYHADGRLLFAGGITGARGHEGDNAGKGSVIALLADGPAQLDRTAVFGCLLENSEPEMDGGE